MKKSLLVSTQALLLLAGISCQKKVTYQTSEKGLQYHFYERAEDGKAGEKGDIYLLEVQAMRPDDSVFLDTRQLGRKLKFERNEEVYPGDFHHALSLMHVGDSMAFKIVADSFYNRSFKLGLPTYLKPDDEIRFFVRVKDIMNPYQHKMTMFEFELEQMESFIEEKKWTVVTDTLTGIKFEWMKQDSLSRAISVGDSIRMKYHYQTLEGKMIARSNPDDWVGFKVGSQQHIPGLSRLLTLCHYGDKVRAIIPFEHALGERGSAYIPPYTTIVSEIEIQAEKQ